MQRGLLRERFACEVQLGYVRGEAKPEARRAETAVNLADFFCQGRGWAS
jgi:hypothetical protein